MSGIPEHGREPVPGLPATLPEGEKILWQGAPDWKRFAIRAMHARKIAIYFGILLMLRVIEQPGIVGHLGFLVLAAVGLGLVLLLARLMARSALYTITNRRVVMRFGIALPMSINLPFSEIESVDVRHHDNGSGDLAIRPAMNRKLSYFVMWPHARPWHFTPMQPMLRCLDDVEAVAGILADALALSGTDAQFAERSARAGSAATAPVNRDQPSFPRPPLIGAGVLIAIVLASVAWWQLTVEPTATDPGLDAVQSIALRFEDRPDGSVAVYDATAGDLIDVLAPGTNNFLRATLRGLVRGRNAIGDLSGRPFILQQNGDGQLLLRDPVTQNHVDLWAFGETNARAFQRFLPGVQAATADDAIAIQDFSASTSRTKENLQ